jgi:hypothetical protein
MWRMRMVEPRITGLYPLLFHAVGGFVLRSRVLKPPGPTVAAPLNCSPPARTAAPRRSCWRTGRAQHGALVHHSGEILFSGLPFDGR